MVIIVGLPFTIALFDAGPSLVEPWIGFVRFDRSHFGGITFPLKSGKRVCLRRAISVDIFMM